MLIMHLPQLRQKYSDEVSWQEGDDTGSHTVFGDVLTPYLIECILQNNQQEMINIFNLLESILCLNDEYADEVISLSVFESMAYLFKEKPYLREFLGEYSRKVLEEFS
jgi:hypothetical protein